MHVYIYVLFIFRWLPKCSYISSFSSAHHFDLHFLADAVTIVLFKVLGAFANRPFDLSLPIDERTVDVRDVSQSIPLSQSWIMMNMAL